MKYSNIIDMLKDDPNTMEFHKSHAGLYNPSYLNDYNEAAMVNKPSKGIINRMRGNISSSPKEDSAASLPVESLSNCNNTDKETTYISNGDK